MSVLKFPIQIISSNNLFITPMSVSSGSFIYIFNLLYLPTTWTMSHLQFHSTHLPTIPHQSSVGVRPIYSFTLYYLLTTSISVLECPMLQTMHPFFNLSRWLRFTTFLLPVHVIRTSMERTTSSSFTTRKPSMLRKRKPREGEWEKARN